jgi:hypothetical protein
MDIISTREGGGIWRRWRKKGWDRLIVSYPSLLASPQPTINDLKKQSLPPAMSVRSPLPSTKSSSKPSLPHLAPLALKITDSIHKVNEAWISSHLSTVLTSPFHLTPHGHLRFTNGTDLYITSWTHMGAEREWCVPSTSTAAATCIRRAAWVSEGGIFVLPRKEGVQEAFEVILSLAEEDMRDFEEGLRNGGWLEQEREGVRAKL